MRWTLIGKIFGDVVLVNFAYILAFFIRFGFYIKAENWQAYLAIAPWITVGAFTLFYSYGLYKPGRHHWEEIFSSVVASVAVLLLGAISLSYMFQQFAFPRTVFLIAFPVKVLLLGIWRRFTWEWSRNKMGPLKLIIVGSFEEASKRAQQIIKTIGYIDFYQVVGLVVDRPVKNLSRTEEGILLIGSYKDAINYEQNEANGLLICSDVPLDQRLRFITEANSRHMSIYIIPEMYDIMLSFSELEQIDGIPAFKVAGLISRPSFEWKRIVDIVFAIVFGLPAIPILTLAALGLKIELPHSPVFFSQERVGLNGKTFVLYKLRSMIDQAENHTGPILASPDDPRITPLGKVLRSLRIDELPQLWNVLKGDMSFVGPRPERPFFVEQFSKEIPGYDYRHQIKTGITGLAQVNGKYSTSAEDKLKYDLLYIKNRNPIFDLQILLNTIKVVLMRNKTK